mgnify:CR=1 FL=1
MEQLSVDHLLGVKYLKEEDIQLIFKTADHFKEVINRPIKKVPSLRDITIANLFFENSTRTKLSFELAEKRLSSDVINFSATQSSVKKGETLIDTVNNILAMKVDVVVMRHPNPGAALFLSKNVDAYRISTFMHKDKGEKLNMGPIWDFNIAFGNADYCGGDLTSGWAYQFGDLCPLDGMQVPFWWDRLMQDTNYLIALEERWTFLRSNILSNENILGLIDELSLEITDSGACLLYTSPSPRDRG